MRIKIESKDLKQKTDEELLKMKETLKLHLTRANTQNKCQGVKGNKGYDRSEIKKNIARINQILNDRKKV